ncbi:hypothetical protein [Occallatibacter riparius]|uniref:Uncharacterized protein n=1 Tax=Occallatibacter riparius TaxID=1002689 RepID=A0A9J7BLJ6_9BACT|nr:hypothetical protein [Occallatibacter riparius]UWZ83519.1 hypothetical protein MOP44_23500 [Occallatibacter riparius]
MIQLSVSDAKLHCNHVKPEQCWAIAVSDVVLIAEYTTDEGPKVDDYFLVFITREEGELYYSNVTMYAAGINESLTALESLLGCSLELALSSSTEMKSRVVWPQKLAGSAYFRYEQVVPEGFWDRVRSRVQGTRMESHVADSVCEYLAALNQPEPHINATESTPSP